MAWSGENEKAKAMSFLCGSRDCHTRVSGIYCDQHKTLPGGQTRETLQTGQRVRFTWYGVEREAIVSKTTRTNVFAVIELKGKRKSWKDKRRIVRVRKSDLLGSQGV